MNKMMPQRAIFLLLAVMGSGQIAWGDDSRPKPTGDHKEVAKVDSPTKISGVFEATTVAEVFADTEQTTSLKIKRLAAHGLSVNQNSTLVVFETKEIDKQIKNAEIELRLAKLKLEDEEFAYQQFLKTQELDRAAAKRSRQDAQQAYDNFLQVDRDRQVLTAEFSLKSSEAALQNATEELEQLEQMYQEDDLTEESEEIVLKRAKQAVESAQFRLDGAKITSARTVEQSIPRSEARQEASWAKAQLTYQKAIHDLASAHQRREIEMNRSRDKFKEQEKKLAELKAERQQAVLKSPIDGIVLHGKLTRGRLGDKPSTLETGSRVTPKQVIATVVNPQRLQIRVALEEKDLNAVTVGARCRVTCKANPNFAATGTVRSVSKIAYAGTKYDCVVSFKPTAQQTGILPTMTCDLEFSAAEQKPSANAKKGKKRRHDKESTENE